MPDAGGGVVVQWSDEGGAPGTYALRVDSAGVASSDWPTNPLLVMPGPTRDRTYPVADGAGGLWVTQVDDGASGPDHLLLRHVLGTGQFAPGFTTGAREIPHWGEFVLGPRSTTDGLGGVLIAWTEFARRSSGDRSILMVHCQSDGVVSTQISLVGVESLSDGVHVRWFAADAAGASRRVQRRSPDAAWTDVATCSADGRGIYAYLDRDVAPGGRYGYRLVSPGSGEPDSPEAWVDVPGSSGLTLSSVEPNPTSSTFAIRCVLPRHGAAAMALFDVAGRRVLHRRWEALTAGAHVLPAGEGARLSPGVYVLRLESGGEALERRVTVVR